MFRQREENEHGSQTKLIVETKEFAAGMLVAEACRQQEWRFPT